MRQWADHLPEWIDVQEADPSRFPNLNRGEAAALAIAVEAHAHAMLADDMQARLAAQAIGIVTVGTVAILAAAHRASLLDFDNAIKALPATSFHIRDSVINSIRSTLLAKPGEESA